ncbi:MAG: hypothetical protein AAGI24_06760 [Pseudomonadota bacterium]
MHADPSERAAGGGTRKSRQLSVLLTLAAVALAIGVVMYLRKPEADRSLQGACHL